MDTLLSHTCKWREVHLKREAICPGMSRLMIHGEEVTATAEGCSFCNLLQLAEKRAQSLHKRHALTQIHCDWTNNAPCLNASKKCKKLQYWRYVRSYTLGTLLAIFNRTSSGKWCRGRGPP